ncbi:GNAT family N-acetyltransferase [Paenibacillus sp. KN14-4R]|uniref:GNAT family N-acetyltransferase n=1 Tax=Paenibacillus sp. KN14-4R TaxID=3445773 RepID=UPI003F9FE876
MPNQLRNIEETDQVVLKFYEPHNKKQLENYYLAEEQLQYTSLPLDAIAKCDTDDERHPIVIFHQDQIAGFFVLHGWEGVQMYSDNRDALLLRAYSINTPYQGKGIAKQSLELLPQFLKQNFPDKNEIILAVNQRNIAAQTVYQKTGFIDKGIRAMGRNGSQLILHMQLLP